MNSGWSKAMTPALSVTKRIWFVVRNSTSGTGQPVPCSTTSMRQGSPEDAAASAQRSSSGSAIGIPPVRIEDKQSPRARQEEKPGSALRRGGLLHHGPVVLAQHEKREAVDVVQIARAQGRVVEAPPQVGIAVLEETDRAVLLPGVRLDVGARERLLRGLMEHPDLAVRLGHVDRQIVREAGPGHPPPLGDQLDDDVRAVEFGRERE